jgi:8-oxo-dGTP diphosphatase
MRLRLAFHQLTAEVDECAPHVQPPASQVYIPHPQRDSLTPPQTGVRQTLRPSELDIRSQNRTQPPTPYALTDTFATVGHVEEQEPVPYEGPLAAKLECASAVFFDAEGRLLVLRHSYGANPWGWPGGVAEADEPPRNTARREVKEEIGLVTEPGPLLVVDWERSWNKNLSERQRAAGWSERRPDGILLIFDGGVLTPDDVAAIEVDHSEIEDYTFLPVAEAVERLDALHARRLLAAVRARETGTVVYLEDGHPPT